MGANQNRLAVLIGDFDFRIGALGFLVDARNSVFNSNGVAEFGQPQ